MTDPSTPPRAVVLVVDDNEANRALARETLVDEGYEVVIATGGREAIEQYRTRRPDCVLLDVNMPDIDGFTVCEAIRAMPGGGETPIVFLTALRDVDTFDRALAAGGDDFLTKPVRPTDIALRVQTALKLRRLRTDLSEQFDLLKRQRDDLLRVQLQKERLTAFVVHDLKNPVSSMDLHAQVLQRDTAVSATGRESIAQIRAGARQLTRMILNLLDVSKADEGKLAPRREPTDLRGVVDSVHSEMEVVARLGHASLQSVVEGAQASVDVDLVRRLLANLVENAIRHAPPKTSVTVTISQSDDETTIRVADAGTGVPVELRDAVFDPFLQFEVDGRPMSRAGRGLGLSFCKAVALAHGGAIWIEDAQPGAVFCVRLG